MPYVAQPPVTTQSRLDWASLRWNQVLAHRPDLEAAVELQRGLLGDVIDLAHRVDRARLPRLSLPPRYLAAKLGRGVPALAGEPIPIPVSLLQTTLLQLCNRLSTGAAAQGAGQIRSVLEGGRLDVGSLLTVSLSRDQEAMRSAAIHLGVSPDLLWLVAELAVSPFAHTLQRALFSSDEVSLSSALAGWSHGHCPACGSWPALAEVAATARVLRCSFCAAAWEMTAYACIYCGEAGEKFVTTAPDPDRRDRRLELCSACGAYLKTIDVAELSPFPLVAIGDLETTDLDETAMEHRFGRPRLREFRKGWQPGH
jgi:FdhE protein